MHGMKTLEKDSTVVASNPSRKHQIKTLEFLMNSHRSRGCLWFKTKDGCSNGILKKINKKQKTKKRYALAWV
jgi:hypothetical protein